MIFVGRDRAGYREIFNCKTTPTEKSHGRKYVYVIGPFRTMFAADLMAVYGEGNVHYQSVYDAERIASFYRKRGFRRIEDFERAGFMGRKPNPAGMGKEKVLYGVKKGEPDYMEQLLSTNPSRFEEIVKLAKRDGFDRFRIATINLSRPPDFSRTIRRNPEKAGTQEEIFTHGNIWIRRTYSPLGKHVEVMIKRGDYFETISPSDSRAREAFIALHNRRVGND